MQSMYGHFSNYITSFTPRSSRSNFLGAECILDGFDPSQIDSDRAEPVNMQDPGARNGRRSRPASQDSLSPSGHGAVARVCMCTHISQHIHVYVYIHNIYIYIYIYIIHIYTYIQESWSALVRKGNNDQDQLFPDLVHHFMQQHL